MIRRELLGSTVEIDLEATREWYGRGNEWACDCAHCRNFLALARGGQLPKQVTELLKGFGIRPEQATYVCQLYEDDKGHHYQFSYRIAGKLIEEQPANAQPLAGHCCHEIYPHGAPDFPHPHFDVEFYLSLPWVLGEDE